PEGVAAPAGQEDGPVGGQRRGGEVLRAGGAAGHERGGGHAEGQRLEVVGAGSVAGGGRHGGGAAVGAVAAGVALLGTDADDQGRPLGQELLADLLDEGVEQLLHAA